MISPNKSSLLPSPYAHAASKKLQPRSTAICSAASDSSSSEPLQPLIPHNPWAISLISNPVRPSVRYFISAPIRVDGRAKARSRLLHDTKIHLQEHLF